MFTLGIRRWLPVYFFTCGVAVWCVGGALAAEEDAAHGDAAAAEVHDGDFHASGAGDGAADHGDASGGHGEGEHGEGAGNPLPVDPDLAIATFIIFLLLMAILWKFAWGPIRDALDSREKGIAGQLAEAARSNEEARRMLAEHEQRLAGAAAGLARYRVTQALPPTRKTSFSSVSASSRSCDG